VNRFTLFGPIYDSYKKPNHTMVEIVDDALYTHGWEVIINKHSGQAD